MKSIKLTAMKKLDPAFRSALDSAYTHAISHLENLDQTSVAATADADALRARVARPLPVEGLPADEVVQELVRNVDGGLIGSAGGRFFGWVIGGVLPAALAADWLTSAWQQNGALYATSPASAIVEETVGDWLKEHFRFAKTFELCARHRMPDGPSDVSRRCASFVVGKT